MIGLILVFSYAIWLRRQLPFVTILSGESYGFLSPSISALSGDGFNQSLGYGFAYPLFLLTILKLTSSFSAIVIVQHVIGVLSGILWVILFRLWSHWLPDSIGRSTWLKWLCPVFLSIYLCNGQNIVFESMVVTEAIFPFCALAELSLTMAFIKLRWSGGNHLSMIACGAGAMLMAVICYSIMPSWGLAALIPFMVLMAGVYKRSSPYACLSSTSAILCGFGLIYVWAVQVPSITGWVVDGELESLSYSNSITDLPSKLFTVHADIISEHFHRKLDSNDLNQDEKHFLENLDRRLDESKNNALWANSLLGHNPDYLMYARQSDALTNLPGDAETSFEKRAAFLQGAFLEAVWDLPSKYGRKVRNQVYVAFSNSQRTVYQDQLDWRVGFIMSSNMFNYFLKADRLPTALKASFDAARKQNQEFALSEPPIIYVSFHMDKFLIEELMSRLLVVLTFGSVFFALWTFLARQPGFASEMRPASLAFLVIVGSCFGMVLTISALSSFYKQYSLATLSVLFSVVLACGSVILSLLMVHIGNRIWNFFLSGRWKSDITGIEADGYREVRRSSPFSHLLKKTKNFFIR